MPRSHEYSHTFLNILINFKVYISASTLNELATLEKFDPEGFGIALDIGSQKIRQYLKKYWYHTTGSVDTPPRKCPDEGFRMLLYYAKREGDFIPFQNLP